jgi:hypothetical protein
LNLHAKRQGRRDGKSTKQTARSIRLTHHGVTHHGELSFVCAGGTIAISSTVNTTLTYPSGNHRDCFATQQNGPVQGSDCSFECEAMAKRPGRSFLCDLPSAYRCESRAAHSDWYERGTGRGTGRGKKGLAVFSKSDTNVVYVCQGHRVHASLAQTIRQFGPSIRVLAAGRGERFPSAGPFRRGSDNSLPSSP